MLSVMLNLLWLPQQAYQKALWAEFNPHKNFWIVNDLKTKFFLNRSLLQKYEIIAEPVKRSKELWLEIIRKIDPEFRLLEDLGSRIQARDFLNKEGLPDWCKRPHAPGRLIEACKSLSTLITNDEAPEILEQLAREFPKSEKSFLEIAQLALQFYRECFAKKKLPVFFAPFVVAQCDDIPFKNIHMSFDLVHEIRPGERDAIQRLARDNDVSVMIPARDEADLEARQLYAYRNFALGVTQVSEKKFEPTELGDKPMEVWRCSSPESEARKAVEKINQWIKEGVKPDAICVTAPSIRDYDSLLSHDLEWEGIGLQRTLTTSLSASRLFRALNARLQIADNELGATLLEEAFLTMAVYKALPRRMQERRVLKPIIEESQVPSDEIRDQIANLRKLRPSGKIKIIEFEKFLIQVFENLIEGAATYENPSEAEQRNSLFLRALQRLRGEIGESELDFSLWRESWAEVTTRINLNYKQAVEGGVWAVDLPSAEETPATHVIILGAVEMPRRHSVVSLLGDVRLKFLAQLGFDLSYSNKQKGDDLIQWIFSGPQKEFVLSCPRTDSAGKSVAASALWLKIAAQQKKDIERLDFATHTTWSSVQNSILKTHTGDEVDKFKNWPAGQTQKIGALIQTEFKGERVVILPKLEANPLPLRLSASRIESFWDCPFKFFSTSYLNLYDEAELDVEPSAQARGQWMHQATENILQSSKPLKDWTDLDLLNLVDSLDAIQKQVSSDIWSSIRSRFVRQLRRFLDYEMEWQKQCSRAKPMGFEEGLRGIIRWSEKDNSVTFEAIPPGQDMSKLEISGSFYAEFRGQVDRVDITADRRGIIIDYKTGTSEINNISSWAKRGQFQLALYAAAAEAGLLEKNKVTKVIAAQYYNLKDPSREKGYYLSDEDLAGVLPTDGTSSAKSAVSGEQHDEYFTEINQIVHGVLEGIRGGNLTPKPQAEKLCMTCSWRSSCRAPHLS